MVQSAKNLNVVEGSVEDFIIEENAGGVPTIKGVILDDGRKVWLAP